MLIDVDGSRIGTGGVQRSQTHLKSRGVTGHGWRQTKNWRLEACSVMPEVSVQEQTNHQDWEGVQLHLQFFLDDFPSRFTRVSFQKYYCSRLLPVNNT